MKWCSKCKETKSPEDFHLRKASKDGLSSWCKSCFKIHDAKRQITRYPKEREKFILRAKNHYIKNREDKLKYVLKWVKENKEKHRAYVKKYRATPKGIIVSSKSSRTFRKNHPEIIKVWNLTKRALKGGIIHLKSSCENCGSVKKLGSHHPDYSKPLFIITLCSSCHAKVTRGVLILSSSLLHQPS
jgi:hypothetical protein